MHDPPVRPVLVGLAVIELALILTVAAPANPDKPGIAGGIRTAAAQLRGEGPPIDLVQDYVGAKALSDIEASRGRLVGRGTAWVGIVLGIIGTLASLGLTWHEAESCNVGVASHSVRYC